MPERMPNTWIADFSFREQTLYPQLCCVVYWLNSIVLENTFITDFKQLLISHPSVKTRLLGFPRKLGTRAFVEVIISTIKLFPKNNK